MARLKHCLIISILLAITATVGWLVIKPNPSQAQSLTDQRAQLQQQLQDIENQITQYQQQLTVIQGQKNTLQNTIKKLQNQQASLNLQIKATNLKIADLDSQIADTQTAIEQNTSRGQQLQQQIAQFIRLIDQRDNYPLLYVVLSKGDLSDAVIEVHNYYQISQGLHQLLDETNQVKNQLQQQAQDLNQQQDNANNLLAIKTLQQQKLTGSVNDQNTLLKETKGQESNYQTALNDSKKQAAAIRNRLYQLLGVSAQITFGEAVQIAQWASGQTGVRTAFLLAILTQESNLGKNVGTCNRAGDPPEKSWRVIMKPDRDQQPFQQITQALGLDINTTPVSCPMHDSNGKQIGWGGAMGPAQFLPSTWLGYQNSVSAITGKSANPWDIRDAFLAAALKLKAGGGATPDGEWAAAMRYFSGSTNLAYRFYGDNVVTITNQYLNDIATLK